MPFHCPLNNIASNRKQYFRCNKYFPMAKSSLLFQTNSPKHHPFGHSNTATKRILFEIPKFEKLCINDNKLIIGSKLIVSVPTLSVSTVSRPHFDYKN